MSNLIIIFSDQQVYASNINTKRIRKYREDSHCKFKSKSTKGTPGYFKKLYRDASVQSKKKLELTNNLFNEQGISFKPKINSNYEVNGNFDERYKRLIELKGQLIEKMNIEKLKKPLLSKEKILENNQRVVDRLYKKEINKIKEKNKFGW